MQFIFVYIAEKIISSFNFITAVQIYDFNFISTYFKEQVDNLFCENGNDFCPHPYSHIMVQ